MRTLRYGREAELRFGQGHFFIARQLLYPPSFVIGVARVKRDLAFHMCDCLSQCGVFCEAGFFLRLGVPALIFVFHLFLFPQFA